MPVLLEARKQSVNYWFAAYDFSVMEKKLGPFYQYLCTDILGQNHSEELSKEVDTL